jgi:hypothetical protein
VAYALVVPHDWWDWHERYYEPGSIAERRLHVIQSQIATFLDSRLDSPVQIVSACAGQGLDILGALAALNPRAAVHARLIELDPRNVAAAERIARDEQLEGVEIVCGDASLTDAYVGATPADLVLMCGVFGNIEDGDIRNTIDLLPQLCAAHGIVIWTRHTHPPDLNPDIRRWFQQSGFEEQAFESAGPKTYAVGVHRLARPTKPLELGRRLFTFTSGYLMLGDEIIVLLDCIKEDTPWHTCRYSTTARFAAIEPLFRRALPIAERDGELDSDGSRMAWDELWASGLALLLPNGRRLERDFTIHLYDDGTARFRY